MTKTNQSSLSSSSPPPYSSSSSSKKSSINNSTKTISTPIGVKNKKQLANLNRNSSSAAAVTTTHNNNKSPNDWSFIAATSIDELNCRPILHTNSAKLKLDSNSNRVSVYRVNSIVGCAIKFLTEAIFDFNRAEANECKQETVINVNDAKRPAKKKSLRIFTDSSFLMITNSSSQHSFKQQDLEQVNSKPQDSNATGLTTPSPLANNSNNKTNLDQIMYERQLDARETVKSIFNLSSQQHNSLTRQSKQLSQIKTSTSNRNLNRNSKVADSAAGKLTLNGLSDVVVKRSKSLSTNSSPAPVTTASSTANSSPPPISSDSNLNDSKQIPFIDDDENLINNNNNNSINNATNASNLVNNTGVVKQAEKIFSLTENCEINKRLNEYVDLITLSSTSTSTNRYSNLPNEMPQPAPPPVSCQYENHQENYIIESNNCFNEINQFMGNNNNNNRSLSLNLLSNTNLKSSSNRTTLSSSPTQMSNQTKRRRQLEQHDEYVQIQHNYQPDQFYDDYDYDYAYDFNTTNINNNNNNNEFNIIINDYNNYNVNEVKRKKKKINTNIGFN